MKAPLIPALVVGLAIAGTLSGCSRISESRFNPLNWFGSSEPVAATLAPEGGYAQAAEDHRQPAAQITRMDLQRVSGGAVLLVTGVAPSLGWWDAELVPPEVSDRPVDGTLAYRLMIAAPRPGSADASRAGTQQTREITVQHFISEVKLAQVNRLVVEGANGARSMRR
ncbi:hypothetical protein ACEYYB_03240 [Paracoccus sp. p4-l81]|uniref:hypothetical protein n=1 Tax=Paracoccus sp. p4-l81 TaxID=3342806 RepID=UPI0035B89966